MKKSWKYIKHHTQLGKIKISEGIKKAYKENPTLRKKLSHSMKSKHNSPNTEFKKGHKSMLPKGFIPWNKDKKGIVKFSRETKKKLSLSFKGKPKPWLKGKKRPLFSKQWKENISKGSIGKKLSELTKKKISEALKGDRSYRYKGGKPKCIRCGKQLSFYKPKTGICLQCKSENRIGRDSIKYDKWRLSVFRRDNYTCQICGIKGSYLEVDHIKSWAYYPELRFEISNGRTLCRNCHSQTETWGMNKYKIKTQWKEFFEKI